MKIRNYLILFLLVTFFSCQPTSLEEFQLEAAAQMRLLLKELQNIETREDLALTEPVIKKHFEKIVEIVTQARLFQQKNPGIDIPVLHVSQVLSQSLLEEMQRIYSLEGGRECIERAQREAMLKLDAKEKALMRHPKPSHR